MATATPSDPLVDEIDLHLHPEWQRTVVPRLASTLKNMQFVLTTHSPIVAGTLESSNIFVVEPDESGASVVHQYRERIHGLSAEQILLSSYFDLQTTRAESMHDELSSLAQRARDGDQSAAVEYMRRLARGSIREEQQQQRNAPRAISKRQTKPAIVTE
jgi:predicted ATP-binding protein involved in virulence